MLESIFYLTLFFLDNILVLVKKNLNTTSWFINKKIVAGNINYIKLHSLGVTVQVSNKIN